MMDRIFKDRHEAGQQLGAALSERGFGSATVVVFGIPRGGIVVADEVARALSAPLDVIVARKIRAPYQPELGIGAIVDGDDRGILNEELVGLTGATQAYLKKEMGYQRKEVERRVRLYRGDKAAPEVAGRTAIVVDDGIATGFTFRAALEGLRRRGPSRLVGAAPVAAPESVAMLQPLADEIVCLSTPSFFRAVGAWYRDFGQVSDEEAVSVLQRNWAVRHGQWAKSA